ncbi:hypothetical protein G6F66_015065 [Rhizopus arrhizus]|nr:hypothetical protein G6F66_015065 [Rhizopus arrhizus]
MPKYGTCCARANFEVSTLPSKPRSPKPPGTRMPSTSASAAMSVPSRSWASSHFRLTLVRWRRPPGLSASPTDL